MAHELIDHFESERSRLNAKVMDAQNLVIKRIYSLDQQAYQEGALSLKTKELLGLACSLVLRCDDCVRYHLGKSVEAGLTDAEIFEAMAISNLIGGTIVIPHLRRAAEYLEALRISTDSNNED